MSIRDEINNRVTEGRLYLLPPLIPSQLMVRTMFVGERLHALVAPPWPDTEEGHRLGLLRGDLDTFTEGGWISIAEDPFKKPNSAYMARTHPPKDEVWDIRSRDPRPAFRVLGCFAETDVFIALEYEYRKSLGGPDPKEWRNFIGRCKATWRRLFPSYPPHKGADLRDYVSSNITPV